MSADSNGVVEELTRALGERVCTDEDTRAAHRADSWMLSELRAFQGPSLFRRLRSNISKTSCGCCWFKFNNCHFCLSFSSRYLIRLLCCQINLIAFF